MPLFSGAKNDYTWIKDCRSPRVPAWSAKRLLESNHVLKLPTSNLQLPTVRVLGNWEVGKWNLTHIISRDQFIKQS